MFKRTLLFFYIIVINLILLSKADSSGFNTIKPDFRVNQIVGPAGADQSHPRVATDGRGNLIAVWLDRRNGDTDIYVQRLDPLGNPLGANFIVNPLDQNQSPPCVAADSSGNFIIAWMSMKNNKDFIYVQRFTADGNPADSAFTVLRDSSEIMDWDHLSMVYGGGYYILTWYGYIGSYQDPEIYAQRLFEDGSPAGSFFKVNDDTTAETQVWPAVAADAQGNFTICWEDFRDELNNSNIYAQRYNSDGLPLGSNFRVDDNYDEPWADQYQPAIAMNGKGEFVIAWSDERQAYYDPNLFAQRFDSSGNPIGQNFKVNEEYERSFPEYASLAIDSYGTFLVNWLDKRTGQNEVYAQFFQFDGSPMGQNQRMSSGLNPAYQYFPVATAIASGDFFTVWQDARTGDTNIYMQRFENSLPATVENRLLNDDTGSSDQFYSSLAVDGQGNAVIVWRDRRDGFSDVYGQRLDSNGNPLGDNFKISADSSKVHRSDPHVAADSSGNYVVVWMDYRHGNNDVYARMFDRNGQSAGDDFIVNDDTTENRQYHVQVDMSVGGNFVVVWTEQTNFTLKTRAQLFAGDGTRLGENFTVFNGESGWAEYNPDVAIDKYGNFVITMVDESWHNVNARRFDASGVPIDSVFQVNDGGVFSSGYPAVDIGSDGNFVIAWQDSRGEIPNIYAQRYLSDGTAADSNFKVTDGLTTTSKIHPHVSIGPKGHFVIAWQDLISRNSNVMAQSFLPDGSPVDNNFLITNTSDKGQHIPKIVLRGNSIYCTWNDNRTGGTGYDIWANILEWNGPDAIEQQGSDFLPDQFKLYQNYPNPFNPRTVISYQLSAFSQVQLVIYNILGQKVRTLVNRRQKAGEHFIVFNANDLASGVYLYKLSTGNGFTQTKKMILLR